MKIEDEIKQYQFQSVYHKAVLNILFTANQLNGKFISVLKPFGISPEQYNILRILRGKFPEKLSVTEITNRMLNRMSNTSRLIEKLHTKGYVLREICPKDRRKAEVIITEQGLEILKKIDKVMPDAEEICGKLTTEEAEKLNELHDKLRE